MILSIKILAKAATAMARTLRAWNFGNTLIGVNGAGRALLLWLGSLVIGGSLSKTANQGHNAVISTPRHSGRFL